MAEASVDTFSHHEGESDQEWLNRILFESKCWAVVEYIHTLRFPERHAPYSVIDPEAYRVTTEDFTMLDPSRSLEEKTEVITWRIGEIQDILAKDDTTEPKELRRKIIETAGFIAIADGEIKWSDEDGNVLWPIDILPDEQSWIWMFHGVKKIRPRLLESWLHKNMPQPEVGATS